MPKVPLTSPVLLVSYLKEFKMIEFISYQISSVVGL
uniref:Uncharacterized protein n=1 Tax=uncultured Flavobacteriia bacterium TaxID=212695 RepID=H6REH0_9BACT|nr:hypothetical protein VIS_S3BDA80024 [uncultured Flavobacteriia bacterium]